MNDFKTTLATRFAEMVDHEAGTPESAPPFVPVLEDDAPDRRSSPGWVLVAAVVVLVAALTWAGLAQVIRLPGPQVAGPPTTSGGSTASADTTAPTTSPSTQASVVGATTTVVGGMSLSLPAGWAVTPQTYTAGSGPAPGSTVWCIDPMAAKGSCTIFLTSAGTASGNALDVDTEGGWLSNPEFCTGAPLSDKLDAADVRSFGGRSAEYRAWTHTCTNKVIHVEQYEVAYAPAWILYSELADSTVSSVMAFIAQQSVLPPQTLPIRLADKGYVRSVSSTTAGYVITLDRVYVDPSSSTGEINNASATYEYTVPKAALSAGAAPKVGDRVYLVSNGTTVTSYLVTPR